MGHHASRKWAITPSGHHGITQRIQTLASQANGPSRHQSLSLSLPVSQRPTTDAQCPPPPRCRTLASQAAQAPQPSPADSPPVRRLPIHRRCLGAWRPAGHRGTACHRPPVISRRPHSATAATRMAGSPPGTAGPQPPGHRVPLQVRIRFFRLNRKPNPNIRLTEGLVFTFPQKVSVTVFQKPNL